MAMVVKAWLHPRHVGWAAADGWAVFTEADGVARFAPRLWETRISADDAVTLGITLPGSPDGDPGLEGDGESILPPPFAPSLTPTRILSLEARRGGDA